MLAPTVDCFFFAGRLALLFVSMHGYLATSINASAHPSHAALNSLNRSAPNAPR